jgi:hypothetical protein
MPADLSPQQLRELMAKLDEVCRQARELGAKIRRQMDEAAASERPARSNARRPRKSKKP